MTGAGAARRVRRHKLAAASKDLFEIGVLEAGPLGLDYVRRLNTVMAQRRPDMEKDVPATLVDAITGQGALKRQAELVVFGNWLINGSPGAKPRPGRQPDPKKMLKCVAAIMAEIKTAARRKAHAQPALGRERRKREITKHALAKQWKQLFDENITAANFDAPLRSARHVLSDYQRHLKSGSVLHCGKTIKSSPEIERALAAITGLLPSQTKRPDIFGEPDAPRRATLAPFEIALEYQSDAHAAEYRQLPPGTRLDPRLRYVPTATATTSSAGKARADREGTITLVPDVRIRNDYQVKALIDRLAILLSTTVKIDDSALKTQIERKAKTKTYVRDLTKVKNEDAWGAPLPIPDLSKKTGYHFAILIQDPAPEMLAAILQAIIDGPGIVEPVQLHLIEVSVDFYPRKPGTLEEAVLRRERMVGILQRHHWTRPGHFLDSDSKTPRYIDARQLYDQETEHGEVITKHRYLFAHEKSSGTAYRNETDSKISDHEIRNRILTTRPGYPLMLNATLVKGGKFALHHVSLQNKIANRRNKANQTYMLLPDDKRRARMEVTISGTETLKKCGLHTIDDLSRVSFRRLTRDFLRCRLPVIEPLQHMFDDAQVQMQNRGVYGINLRLRALAVEKRLAAKQAGKKLPRKTKNEELGLANWREMNGVIGEALDDLQRRWSKFTAK